MRKYVAFVRLYIHWYR